MSLREEALIAPGLTPSYHVAWIEPDALARLVWEHRGACIRVTGVRRRRVRHPMSGVRQSGLIPCSVYVSIAGILASTDQRAYVLLALEEAGVWGVDALRRSA